MNKYTLTILRPLILLLTLVFVSCERRPLEEQYVEGEYCDILLKTDWKLLDEEPTGLTAMFFPEDGSSNIVVMSNNTVGNTVRLRRGKYKAVVFNQSIYEFGSMNFSDIDKFETICARLVGLSSSVNQETVTDYNWVKSAVHNNADSLAMVVRNIENFNADRFTYEVTKEMCKRQIALENEVKNSGWGNLGQVFHVDTIYSTPPPVAPTMHINVRVKGIENIYSVRAYISNMARADLFGPHVNAAEEAIHVISDWTIQKSTNDKTRGQITSSFRTFGTPSMQVTHSDVYQQWGGDSTRGSGSITLDTYGKNRLYIEFLLRDGTTVIAREFDVSDCIIYTEDELLLNIDIDIEVELPDVPDQLGSGGAGFDAEVEEWKHEDKDITL